MFQITQTSCRHTKISLKYILHLLNGSKNLRKSTNTQRRVICVFEEVIKTTNALRQKFKAIKKWIYGKDFMLEDIPL